MATFNNGESLSSVRTKINAAIDKIDGNATISNDVTVGGNVTSDKLSTGDGYAMPDVRPSLLLDFANSKTLDPRITFTRGSTATYWDGHTTTKAEENLVRQADSINYNRGSASGNQTAPTGSSETYCYLYTEDTNGSSHDIYHYDASGYVSANTTFTASVYVKANGRNFVTLSVAFDSNSYIYAHANLSTGAITETNDNGTGNYVSSSITSVGNSWYRISVTGDLGSNTAKFIFTAGADSATPSISGDYGRDSYTGDGTSGWYVYGYQIELRDGVTAYTDTTTSAVVKYQPTLQTAASGEARFDHDPVTGESKGLLIEESRTNLVTYSEGTSGWTLYNNGTLINDVAVAPDGTRAAQVFNYDGGSATLRINTGSLTNGTTYTMSVYLKSNNADTPSVNLQIGDTTVLSGQALTNEWVRYTGTGTTAVTGYNFLDIEIPSGSDISIWGAQLETGAFPTSYIPTSGSTVTRSKDLAEMTGTNFSSWYSHNEGTLCLEAATADVSLLSEFNISDGSSSNRIMFAFRTAASRAPYLQRFGTNIGAIANNTGLANNVFSTLAIALKDDDIASSLDGQSVQTLSVAVPKSVDSFQIGSTASGSTNNALHIKKFAFYPQRLSNATLQAMTEE